VRGFERKVAVVKTVSIRGSLDLQLRLGLPESPGRWTTLDRRLMPIVSSNPWSWPHLLP